MELDGVIYKSVELAYQAAKWKPEHRDRFQTCSELDSITYNRERVPDRYAAGEWDSVKIFIMKDLLEQKFDPIKNPELYLLLKDTGSTYIEEYNWWGDVFWGVTRESGGQNMLGKLLMEVRG